MSLTLASGGSRTLSRPMSKSLLPLSANTALKPASSVRSTYRPGTMVDLAAVLLLPSAFARLFLSPPRPCPAFLSPLALPLMSPLPASVLLPLPFPSHFCPTASPPAESFLKFFIILSFYAAMIVLSRLPRNKETSKDERNRKICAGARKVVWCPQHRFTMASGKGYRERLQKRYNLARELLSSGILPFRLEYRSLKTL